MSKYTKPLYEMYDINDIKVVPISGENALIKKTLKQNSFSCNENSNFKKITGGEPVGRTIRELKKYSYHK